MIAVVLYMVLVGVANVMGNPPTELMTEPIEVSVVPIKEVWPDTPLDPPPSSTLLIENLPTDCPEDMIKIQFEYLFKKQGLTVEECRIENDRGYYTFKEPDGDVIIVTIVTIILSYVCVGVARLVSDPPDGSRLSGHPIKYSVHHCDLSPPTSMGPCVLVIDGVDSSMPKIEDTLKFYLKNVAQVSPLSCVVTGQQAIVTFSDCNGK